MFWLAVFVLRITHPASTQGIKLEFLREVPRLFNETTIRDYYFCCNVEGRFLQWEYSNQPLTGFQRDNIGRVVVDERSDYTYTATLLSSQPMENSQAIMDSVLVMSFANDMDPGQFMITCSSDHNITNIITTPDPMSFVENTKENGGVHLDYVTSGNIASNRNKTHIFMCGVNSTSQFVEVSGPALGFSQLDDVGQTRNVFSQNGNTVDVQGILIARENTLSVTLILIASEFEEVNVSCCDSVSCIFLLSIDSEIATNNPEPTTAPTLIDGSTTDDHIDFTEESTLVDTVNPGVPIVAWLLPTVLTSLGVPVAALIAIFLAIFMWRNCDNDSNHEGGRKLGSSVEPAQQISPSTEPQGISEEEKAETVSQKEDVSEEENRPEEDIISGSNYQELEHKPELRSLPGGETQSHQASFVSSYEETSFNGKTSAPGTASKPSHTSIDMNETDDLVRRLKELHNNMNSLVRKSSRFSTKSYEDANMVPAAKCNWLLSTFNSERVEPIYSGGNVKGLHIGGQHDNDVNEALPTPNDIDEESNVDGERIEEDTEEDGGKIECKEKLKDGMEVEGGEEYGGNGDSVEVEAGLIDGTKEQHEVYHSPASVPEAEKVTTPLYHKDVMYCFVVMKGWSKEFPESAIDDPGGTSQMSQSYESVGPKSLSWEFEPTHDTGRINKVSCKDETTPGETDNSSIIPDDDDYASEGISGNIITDGRDAIGEMVIRRRLKKH